MTYFTDAGYTKDTKFKIVQDFHTRQGKIVQLSEDDGSNCPWFRVIGEERDLCFYLPGQLDADDGADLEVYVEESELVGSPATSEITLTSDVVSDTPVGIKHDSGKPRWSLLDFQTLSDVVDVLEMGGKKYGYGNYKHVEPIRYVDSTFRHIMAYIGGEELDEESGKSHLHHAICGLMFLDYFRREGVKITHHGEE